MNPIAPQLLEEVIPTTSQLSIVNQAAVTPIIPNASETQTLITAPTMSLEAMILSTIQQKHLPQNKQKKRKVASGAEVVTSASMIELLKEKHNKGAIKKSKINKKAGKKGKGKKRLRT